MPDPDTQPSSEPTPMTYEQAVEELESIVQRIESGEVGLEESIKLYERGVTLLRRCRQVLDQAEQRLTELDASLLGQDEQGSPGR